MVIARIVFTNHAKRRIEERGLSEKTVRYVLKTGTHSGVKRGDGLLAVHKRIQWQNREVLCRVIYVMTSREFVRVITAYVTTKFDKYE